MKLLTLSAIWNKFSNPLFSYLIVKDQNGNIEFIEGSRPADPDGGCQATGTPETIYGRSPSGEHWWNQPKGKSSDKAEWTFVKGYSEKFFVRDLKTGEVLRGIEETPTSYWLIKEGKKLGYGKENFEKVEESSFCPCCQKESNPKKSFFSSLFS